MTFTDDLPPTKSAPQSGIQWTPTKPGCGLLIVEKPRQVATYAVTEFQTPWDGRAFHFVCLGGQSDKEAAPEGYDVFFYRGGQDHQCSCKGFAHGRGKLCKHLEAVRAIITNGWMDAV